jgi:hypothetical protein
MHHVHPMKARTLRVLGLASGLALALTSCSPSSSQEEAPAAASASASAASDSAATATADAVAAPENSTSAEPKILDSSAPEASVTAEAEVTLSDLCGTGCSVSGIAHINHPSWGQIRVVTMLTERVISGASAIAAVDEDEVVLWSTQMGQMLTMSPAATSQDATGNVFINYDPGRYNGVIVLRPTAEGFDDLQTLPGGEAPGGRFYYAAPQGEAEEEVSIWQYTNDGIPDYATGTVTKEQFVWDGNDYVSAGPPQLATGSPDEPYAAVRGT